VVTRDQKQADVLTKAGVTIQSVAGLRADDIARIGYGKLQRGETVSPEALDATYIRRSEAEIKFAERTR